MTIDRRALSHQRGVAEHYRRRKDITRGLERKDRAEKTRNMFPRGMTRRKTSLFTCRIISPSWAGSHPWIVPRIDSQTEYLLDASLFLSDQDSFSLAVFF
jgi:hypothetical protein